MKKMEKNFENLIRNALRGKQVPILVLDNRWHTMFPKGRKPAEIASIETNLNKYLKLQGKLINEMKDLKVAKQRLMQGIVAGMEEEGERGNRKKDNQQRLLLETSSRIQECSEQLMYLPKKIQLENEKLMVYTAQYCFEQMTNSDGRLRELKQEIRELRERLADCTEEKEALEEGLQNGYALMHNVLGPEVMNLYDKGKLG